MRRIVLTLLLICVSASASETTTYTYDALGRLVVTSKSDGAAPNGQITTSFDAAGNRTNYSVTVPPPPGVVSFQVATPPTVSAGTPLVFTITKSGSTSASYSLSYATADGTAVAGSHYTATTGSVTFAPSETSKTVSVATNGNAVGGPRTILLNLSGVSGGATIAVSQATGTVNYQAGGAIILTSTPDANGFVTVLPAHTSSYYCTSGNMPQVCIVTASGGGTVYQNYNGSQTLASGYIVTAFGELQVDSAFYGTAP